MHLYLRFVRIALALAISGLGWLAATAQADTYTLGPYPGGSISIPATGKGAPYPSGFGLGSAGGKLAGMTAQVNLTHSFVSDIDLMLVSPQGQGVMLMSDNCLNQSVSGMVLTFSDAAASTLPDTATCASGTYKPSNRTTEIPDTFPDAVTDDPAATLSVFNGIDPTGFWRMYAIDDNSGDSGSISNWSLTFEIEPAEIQIPESGTSGTAGPYPSTKTFETPPGQVISDLQLNLNGFGHESPEDVHAMLADDKGHAVELFADACGSSPLYDIKWTFGDSFPYLAGDSGTCSGGEVQPAGTIGGFAWPAPAPAPEPGNFSDVFGGREGGKWHLYVVDDKEGDFGYINGWNLGMTTRQGIETGFAPVKVPATEGKTASMYIFREGPTPRGPATVKLTPVSGSAKSGKDFRLRSSTLRFGPQILGLKIAVPVVDDGVAEKAEKFKVTLSGPDGDATLRSNASTATVTIAASSNATLKTGKLTLDRKKGSGSLAVRISSPGRVTVSGAGIRPASVRRDKPGRLKLPVRASGKSARDLKRSGKVAVKARVSYRTTGGRKITRIVPVTLKLNR